MKHLFYGLEQVEDSELSQCLAEAETYTVGRVWKSGFAFVGWLVKWVWSKITKKTAPDKPLKLQEQCEAKVNQAGEFTTAEYRKYMLRVLSRRLKCKVKEAKSDDENSAAVTNAIRKTMRKKKSAGYSNYEINQKIHSDFPGNKVKPGRWLLVYQLVNWLLLIALIAALILVDFNKWILLGIWFVLLVVWSYACDGKLRRNALKKFVWLAVSGMNNGGDRQVEDRTGREELVDRFRVVHTLSIQIENNQAKIREQEKQVERLKEEQKKNNELINSTDNVREREDKLAENRQKQTEIIQIAQANENLLKECEEHQKTCGYICETTAKQLQEYWKSAYPSVLVDTLVLEQMVYAFSFEDLYIIEKRFEELLASGAPVAIAKKRGKQLCMEFRTKASGISCFYFEVTKNGIAVNGIKSGNKLTEDSMSLEELSRVLKAFFEELYVANIPQPSKDLEKYIAELECKIAEEKQHSEQVVSELNQEINDLNQKQADTIRLMENIQSEYDQVQQLADIVSR